VFSSLSLSRLQSSDQTSDWRHHRLCRIQSTAWMASNVRPCTSIAVLVKNGGCIGAHPISRASLLPAPLYYLTNQSHCNQMCKFCWGSVREVCIPSICCLQLNFSLTETFNQFTSVMSVHPSHRNLPNSATLPSPPVYLFSHFLTLTSPGKTPACLVGGAAVARGLRYLLHLRHHCVAASPFLLTPMGHTI
jgi:hypothetical protein